MHHNLQYLHRTQIDTQKWDQCITNAANGLLYAHSFYLDHMADNWDALVLGEELERAKPDPLPYATALERLGAPAERALAFEDSLPGIRSASGAGVATYGIRTGHPDAALLGAGAVGAIDDFTDSQLWRRLESMF